MSLNLSEGCCFVGVHRLHCDGRAGSVASWECRAAVAHRRARPLPPDHAQPPTETSNITTTPPTRAETGLVPYIPPGLERPAPTQIHPPGLEATHPTPAGEATHHCKYSQLVRKLDAWVKVATEKLGQLKEQVERREGQDTVKVKVEEAAVMTGNEEKPEVKVDAGTGMSPVKTEREETMEVNEYGTKITAARNQPAVQQVKVKVEPESTMTAIKPKVEYKVGTATKREHRGGSFGFDGAAKISRIEGRVMGTIKQDLEGNIVNKPVGMYSVVQRLKTDPEIHEMAQREDMMKKVRDAEEETRRVKEELRKLKEDMGGLGLGLCGRDGQVRKPGAEPLPAGGAIMMDIDSDTDGGAILELNEIKQPRFLHTATQTDWVGKSQFHKATQFPITHYSSDELRSMSADLVPVKKASLYSGESMQLHVSTQTEWLGHSAMHKAIQFPEITYCKEEEKPKDLPPYVPAANPLPPVIQQWKPVPEVHPPTPAPAPTPTPASQAPVVTTTTSVTKTNHSDTRERHTDSEHDLGQTGAAGGICGQDHHPEGEHVGQRQSDGGAGGAVRGVGAPDRSAARRTVHAAPAGSGGGGRLHVPAVRIPGAVRPRHVQPNLLHPAVQLPGSAVRLPDDGWCRPAQSARAVRRRLPRTQVNL